MRERAIRFGKSTPLIGVLSEPPLGTERVALGVVFLNSGILHHVGACRLHVRLARQLAEKGFTSIRFDLSGIGDSEARKDSLTFEQSAQREVQEAMDYLTATKRVNQFLLIGLCSGADVGFLVSQIDERVVGLVQLDAHVYRTFGYWLRYYAPKVVSLPLWVSFLKRKLGLEAAPDWRGPEPGADYVRPEYRRKIPPKETVADGLRTLTARGVELLFMFSAGPYYNHRGQFRRCFASVDFGNQLEVEYYRTSDHLFSSLEHQRLVDEATVRWAAKVGARRGSSGQPQPSVVPIEPAATKKIAPAPVGAGK